MITLEKFNHSIKLPFELAFHYAFSDIVEIKDISNRLIECLDLIENTNPQDIILDEEDDLFFFKKSLKDPENSFALKSPHFFIGVPPQDKMIAIFLAKITLWHCIHKKINDHKEHAEMERLQEGLFLCSKKLFVTWGEAGKEYIESLVKFSHSPTFLYFDIVTSRAMKLIILCLLLNLLYTLVNSLAEDRHSTIEKITNVLVFGGMAYMLIDQNIRHRRHENVKIDRFWEEDRKIKKGVSLTIDKLIPYIEDIFKKTGIYNDNVNDDRTHTSSLRFRATTNALK